jgi:ribosomal protein L20A (L18A)
MTKLKVFRVTGKIYKPNLNTDFVRELIADKPEHAKERVHMKVTKVEEVSPEEIKNPILKKLVVGE